VAFLNLNQLVQVMLCFESYKSDTDPASQFIAIEGTVVWTLEPSR
jgi:hypothetical protein